jgi:hypothetical protein
VPSTARDALIAIAALLAPDEPDVADRVAHAHHDPNAYRQAHADRLDERGIDEPIPNLAWIALVDALTDRGLLAEVDWKESAEEIIAQLRGTAVQPVAASGLGLGGPHRHRSSYLRLPRIGGRRTTRRGYRAGRSRHRVGLLPTGVASGWSRRRTRRPRDHCEVHGPCSRRAAGVTLTRQIPRGTQHYPLITHKRIVLETAAWHRSVAGFPTAIPTAGSVVACVASPLRVASAATWCRLVCSTAAERSGCGAHLKIVPRYSN